MAGAAELDRNGMVVLDEETCWVLVARAPIGRLAFVDHGRPEVRPMNHLVRDGELLLVTRSGGKLEAVLSEPGRPVVYEVDEADPSSHAGWSVLVRGRLRAVLDAVEQRQLDQLGPPSWIDTYRDRRWLRLEASEVTGRRLLRSSRPDA